MPLPESYYTSFLSQVAKSRKPSAIRSLYPLEKKEGVISLLAGKPNPTTFPITGLSVTARSPKDDTEEKIDVPSELVSQALQYGPTAGLPQLVDWFIELQRRYHGRNPEIEGWALSVGTGSQDLLSKATTALVDAGDPVLVESPVYAGVIPLFHSLGCEQIEVETDAHGISSSSLRQILESWPKEKKKPRILYTIPYGCNPTGMTASLERRKEVLQLAREHDLLIIEDDPYFFLYFGKAPRYPSYFSLEKTEGHPDQIGRVLRLDSLSKVLSAGIRIGFVSGPSVIVDAMNKDTSNSNLQTSSLTQVVTYSLLNNWGYEQFQAHVDHVAEFYRQKRDVFESAMKEAWGGSEHPLVSWVAPEAGMFYWFRLHLPPSFQEDSEHLIRNQAYQNGILCLPGTAFLPNGRKSPYVRASFSLNPEEEVKEALKRLKQVLEQAWRDEGKL